MTIRSAGLLLIPFIAGAAQAADVLEAKSEAIRPEFAAAAKRESWRSAATAAPTLRLPALAPERAKAVDQRNRASEQRRFQIGVTRAVASEAVDALPQPSSQSVAGGTVLRLDVASDGAKALRVGLRVDAWPNGAELRVAGTTFADDIYAVDAAAARSQADPQGVFWTAVTDGERQSLELFVPSAIDPATVSLKVVSVAHLLVAPQTSGDVSKALGDSGSCNIDVVCRTGTLGQPFVSAKNSVARMVFQSDGGTYTCTGTVLNDLDANTQIPWFYTAHHCIGNQTEASSVTTFWNYETPTCGVDQSGPNTQVTGGSQLLYSQSSTDGALLRLNGSLPGTAVLAGWNANAMNAGDAIIAIHHPSGDIKKYSRGTYSGLTSGVSISGQIVDSSFRVTWAEGTTEGGSSGSGLFTFNGGYQLRGGLAGGSASCSNSGGSEASGNRDYYSRLDVVFPAIQQYIASTGQTGPGPTRDYTGQWDLSTEAGRGLSMFSYSQNILFALWFVYDAQGRAAWYQLDAQWTGTDVASGRVVRWTGSPWGPTYNPGARVLTQTGTFTLTFTSATTATFAYNVDGVNRTITLTKFVF